MVCSHLGPKKGAQLALLDCTFPLFLSFSPQSDKWVKPTPLTAGMPPGRVQPPLCLGDMGMFLCRGAEALAGSGSSVQGGARDDALGPGDSPLPWVEEAMVLQCPKFRGLEAAGASERVWRGVQGWEPRRSKLFGEPPEKADVKYVCIRHQLSVVCPICCNLMALQGFSCFPGGDRGILCCLQ